MKRRAVVVALALLVTVAVGAAPASAQIDPNDAVTADRDWDVDGRADLVALTPDGRLFVYRGNTAWAFWSKPPLIASGLRGFTSVRLAGDVDEDGDVDVLARRGGELWLIRGTPAGTFGGMVQIAGNWASYEEIVPVDVDLDGMVDLLAFDHGSGMRIYWGRSGVTFRFGNFVPLKGVDSLGGFGDSDRDGYQELLVRNLTTGDLWALETNHTSTVFQHKSQHRIVSTIAPGATLSSYGPPSVMLAAGDLSGDGLSDIFHLSPNHDVLLLKG